jgi:hypothetical protein
MVLERNPKYRDRFLDNMQPVECLFLSNQPAKCLQMYEDNELDVFCDLPPRRNEPRQTTVCRRIRLGTSTFNRLYQL